MGWGEPLDRFLGGVIFPVVTKQDQQAGHTPASKPGLCNRGRLQRFQRATKQM